MVNFSQQGSRPESGGRRRQMRYFLADVRVEDVSSHPHLAEKKKNSFQKKKSSTYPDILSMVSR